MPSSSGEPMRRLLVNDILTAVPGTRTLWHDLMDWFSCEFVGGGYENLADVADRAVLQIESASKDGVMFGVGGLTDYPKNTLIIRNASYFPSITASVRVPTISILQDILDEGPMRDMQLAVMETSRAVVFNSEYTLSKYPESDKGRVIPLPVDFALFQPGNPMGLQQALGLPENCVLWVGACQGHTGHVKGFHNFISVVRANPDLSFVAVFKDDPPEYYPPNLRMYSRLPHSELVRVIGACRVGLCTSLVETQHLAGIEMGACGLPVVAPPVGTYWKREGMPGAVLQEPTTAACTEAVRSLLAKPAPDPAAVRDYWQKEFDVSVAREKWTALVEEVERGVGV